MGGRETGADAGAGIHHNGSDMRYPEAGAEDVWKNGEAEPVAGSLQPNPVGPRYRSPEGLAVGLVLGTPK